MKQVIRKIMPTKIMLLLYRVVNGNFNYFLWIFPIDKNKIVISNFHGKTYGDNGKYIVEELNNENLGYKIVWLVDKKNSAKSLFPENVQQVNYKSFRGLYELATAKIWIDNCRKSFYPPKRKNQFYIQTWHGGIPLKRIEKDVEKTLNSLTVQTSKNDSKIADLFISNSDFCSKLYQRSFWYNGGILECGSPRCDVLLNKKNEVYDKVKKHFKLDQDTNILLYAPTFRSDLDTSIYNIDFEALLDALENRYRSKWVIMVRLHPNIANQSNFMKYSSNIINTTDYDDMYELLAVSNVLVTDYSSTMFEFSLTNKPVIIYAPDIESYIEDRNFYFDLRSLPFPIAENNEQLFRIFENLNSAYCTQAMDKFFLDLGVKESGQASKRVVEKICAVIEGEN